MRIKAITLWQPWASLMALGYKTIETRSWSPSYTGLLAIHAAKKKGDASQQFIYEKCVLELGIPLRALPYGAIVAVVNLREVILTGNVHDWENYPDYERVFGDFTPGRWAWKTKLILSFHKPYPVAGKQSLWNWEVPKEIEQMLLETKN